MSKIHSPWNESHLYRLRIVFARVRLRPNVFLAGGLDEMQGDIECGLKMFAKHKERT